MISPWTPWQGARKAQNSSPDEDVSRAPRRYNFRSNGFSKELVGAGFLVGVQNYTGASERNNLIARATFMRRNSRLKACMSRAALLMDDSDSSIPSRSDHVPRNVAETAFAQHVAIQRNLGVKVPPRAIGLHHRLKTSWFSYPCGLRSVTGEIRNTCVSIGSLQFRPQRKSPSFVHSYSRRGRPCSAVITKHSDVHQSSSMHDPAIPSDEVNCPYPSSVEPVVTLS